MPAFETETKLPRCEPPGPGFRPPLIYRARLDELEGCHFEITCACGHRSNTPAKAFVRHHGGPQQALGAMLERLKCSRCKARPASVVLNECWLKHFAYGPPRGWSIQVWPMTS